jgi:hypothetical protein
LLRFSAAFPQGFQHFLLITGADAVRHRTWEFLQKNSVVEWSISLKCAVASPHAALLRGAFTMNDQAWAALGTTMLRKACAKRAPLARQ